MGHYEGVKSPCYKCENHKEGCHSTCEDYLEWDEERRELREAKHKETKMKSAFIEMRHKRWK